MQAIQNNNRLPSEVLGMIFKHLNERNRVVSLYMMENDTHSSYCIKKDLKTFSQVCKSWNYVAQDYFRRNISIDVAPSLLPTLLKFLPGFGYGVKFINLTASLIGYEATARDCNNFMNVLKLCPNLISLCIFTSNLSVSQIMIILLLQEMKIKNIQYIFIRNVTFGFERNAYYSLLIRHSATLKILRLLKYSNRFINKNYDGLTQFLSNFPNLTYLKIYCSSHNKEIIDIKQILENAPQLQKLKVHDAYKITADFQSTNTKKQQDNIHLIKLKLHSDSMNMKSLKYITSNVLTNIDNLILNIKNLIPDITLSEEESKKILREFETICIPKTINASVNYGYKNKKVGLYRGNHCYIDTALSYIDDPGCFYYELGHNDYYTRRLSNISDDNNNVILWRLADSSDYEPLSAIRDE